MIEGIAMGMYKNFCKRENKFTFRYKALRRFFLCIILTICLVFGTGVDLSFASEFLPEGPQDVYISQLQSQTLYASKDSKNTSSYQWQICVPGSNEFIPINGETKSSLEADAALVKNALDFQNVAKIKCLSFDAQNTEIASKLYTVHFDPATDSLNQQIADSAAASLNSNLTGQTISATNAEDNAEDLEVTINYFTSKGQSLGISNTMKFDRTKYFDWSIQIINLGEDVTLATENPIMYDNYEDLLSHGFEATLFNLKTTNDGIYIIHNETLGEIPDSYSNIDIRIYFDMPDVAYRVNAFYQYADDSGYDEKSNVERHAPVGTAVPTILSEGTYESDIDYFTKKCYKADPTG